MAKQQKKPLTPIEKPLLFGSRALCPQTRTQALKLLAYQLLGILMYFLLGSALNFDSLLLRLLTNLVLIAVVFALCYMNGSNWGVTDAQFSEIMYRREAEGKEVPASERDKCYNMKKAIAAWLLGCAPFVVLAVILAVSTSVLGYRLQALPSWMTARLREDEFSGALGYYESVGDIGLLDILRTVVRVDILPFIQIVGGENAYGLYLVERLSPLLVLLVPFGLPMGYRMGRRDRAMTHGSIARNERRKKIKEKKERRRQRKEPEQLI